MTFDFKPFDEMTPEDYQAIGLKAGLEIHQQLLTRRKLFCRCPAGQYRDTFHAEILRHMRPTLSELGEYDGTALMEFKTKKEIIYRIHSKTVCTYEMDDTPPFMIDEEALDIALQAAIMLNLNLVDELHIARKQYLDGSIPTGFQRTTIFGVDGWIPYKGRRIGIAQLGLEEDACREVSDVGHQRVYLTDRLGMPLIEPVTYPEMRTPQEAAEVAEILRRLLRTTGKMRTGYGAGRQDVNVSVTGGTRIEIKGVPRIPRIPLLIYNEAMRQWALLRIRDTLKDRGITPETFAASDHDVTRALNDTKYTPLQEALYRNEEIRCVKLDGFAGILAEKTQTNTHFAKEIGDRVRVISCLTRLPNIAHTDAVSEALTGTDWKLIRQKVKAGPEDALILVWGSTEDTTCACREIIIRAREATEGVPSETRQALKDGTTGFERILPGADRMYPDTDLPPIALGRERIERIRAILPEPPWKREDRYRPMNLPADVVDMLITSPRAGLFNRLVEELAIKPTLAGGILCRSAKALRRSGLDLNRLTDEEIYTLFKAHKDRVLAREGILKVLRHLLANGRLESRDSLDSKENLENALQELGLKPVPRDEVKSKIQEQLEQSEQRTFKTTEKRYRFLMGLLMDDLLGRAEGSLVSHLLEEALSKREDRHE